MRMAIGSNKSEIRQDIIWWITTCLISLSLFSCATQKEMQLTDISPKYKDFQGTDLDPLVGKKEYLPFKSSNPTYDDYMLAARKSISTIQFAERTALVIEGKRANKQDIQKELNALSILEEDLPSIVSSIPALQQKGNDLYDTVPNDFEGPKIGKISADLNKINDDLKRLAPIAPGILQSILDIKGELKAEEKEANDKALAKSNEIQPTKADPKVETLPPPVQKNDKDKKKSWKEFLPPEEKKETLVINKLPNKAKVSGSTKGYLATQAKEIEDETLTDEEKRERDYNDQIRKGLVEVFKSEYYRSSKNLEKLLLTHPIPRVRSAAALALGRIKSGRATLQKVIDSDGYQVRPAAYKALADIGDKRSLSYFIAGTKAEDPEVVAASFEGIGKCKDPAGRELILNQGITSDYVIIVAGAIRGLGYNDVPADLELIEKFLKSDEEEITEAAVEALALHESREALRILERAVVDFPKLSLKILDEIGKNPKLSATFSLIRLNESSIDETLKTRIGEHLLRRKAFGKYAFILIENDFLRMNPNERSAPMSYIKKGEIGLVLSATKKEFSVRMDESIVTDIYLNLKMESSTPGSKNAYVSGWVFNPKVEIIEIKKLGGSASGKYSHIKAGKHQNLFNPADKTNTGGL